MQKKTELKEKFKRMCKITPNLHLKKKKNPNLIVFMCYVTFYVKILIFVRVE